MASCASGPIAWMPRKGAYLAFSARQQPRTIKRVGASMVAHILQAYEASAAEHLLCASEQHVQKMKMTATQEETQERCSKLMVSLRP